MHSLIDVFTSDYVINALLTGWEQFKNACVIYCVGMMFESILRPAEENQPLSGVGFNIAFTAIFLLVINFLVPPAQALIKPLVDQYGLGIPLAFPDTHLGQLAQTVVFFFIFDFFYYWLHRTQHVIPAFWAWHKFHHSDYAVNITTGYRHHWLEEPVRVFAILLPMGILFQQKTVTIAWIWTGLLTWAMFSHANVRLRLGPFAPLLSSPQMHRIHHSSLEQHHDRNFVILFPIIDIMFGTYYKPHRDEYPPTGLDTGERLDHFWHANVSPFREWWRMARGHRASEPASRDAA